MPQAGAVQARSVLPPWLLLAASLLASGGTAAASDVQLLPADQTTYGGPFSLVDHHGRAVTEQDFLGDYLLLYFGYTNCADACPTALAKISAVMRRLGARAERLRPLFINIDAEGATVAELATYVGYFHPRLIGLTGSAEQVRRAAAAYRVYYVIAEVDGARVISHTGYLFLAGPDGRVLTYFSHGSEPDEMAETIATIMDRPPTETPN